MSLNEMLPILIPLIVLEVGLTGAALYHIFTHRTYKMGTRMLWVIISFISIIGPVAYFIVGKGDE